MQTVKYSKFKTLFRLADNQRRRSSFSFTVMRSPPSPFGFIFAQRNEQEEAEKINAAQPEERSGKGKGERGQDVGKAEQDFTLCSGSALFLSCQNV